MRKSTLQSKVVKQYSVSTSSKLLEYLEEKWVEEVEYYGELHCLWSVSILNL